MEIGGSACVGEMTIPPLNEAVGVVAATDAEGGRRGARRTTTITRTTASRMTIWMIRELSNAERLRRARVFGHSDGGGGISAEGSIGDVMRRFSSRRFDYDYNRFK